MFRNPVLIGAITIFVVVLAVYLSYIAENGLPFVPTYNVKIQVANGGELVKNADVRIGGALVGQVLTITPEPANHRYPHPYAQLGLALDKNIAPLPVDTHYQVRLQSILGAQFVQLFPGSSHRGLPDGGTLTISSNPRQNHNIPYVDVSQAFDVFGSRTERGLRAFTNGFGNALAGRGAELNEAAFATARLIGPFESLLRLFGAPTTNLSGFIDGLASTTGALAPVAPQISSLLAASAITSGALDHRALGSTIDELPSTEQTGTTVLTRSLPVLREAATLIRDLRPGVVYLPTAARHLTAILSAAPATFRLLTPVSTRLETALAAANRLALDPAAIQTFKVLGTNDLATAGSSTFVGLGAILATVSQAQFACNVAGLWVRNFASALSDGDTSANWLLFMPMTDGTQLLQASTPSSDLHINPYPIENSSECQAGNETYSGAQKIGNPGQTPRTVDNTAPPPGVLAEGERAGLVP
jgi:virulence factor Mce-like protein